MATSIASPRSNQMHSPQSSRFSNQASSSAPSLASSRRPKLSLNTQCTSSFGNGSGKKSTGLRLDAISATSPTARNTFKNAFDVPVTPQTTTLPLSSSPFSPSQTLSSSSVNSSEASSASFSSLESTPASSVTTPDSEPETPKIPYSVPQSVRSILTNSPLSKKTTSRSCLKSLDKPKDSFTSASKKVDFKQPLWEEIQTSIYLLAHSDLRSRSTSPEPIVENDIDCNEVNPSAEVGRKREEDDFKEDDAEENDEQYPKTPLLGRRKRRREWVWTISTGAGVDVCQHDADTDEELASPTKRAAPSIEWPRIENGASLTSRDDAKDHDRVAEGPVPLRIEELEDTRICP